MSVFGPIVDGSHVERAVEATLRKWLPAYLAEVERQNELPAGSIAEPRTFSSQPTFGKFRDDQMPLVLILSGGLAGKPERRGDGMYTVPWALGVAVVTAAKEGAAGVLSKRYIAAIRAALLQHKSLDGKAESTYWEEERYDDIILSRQRTLASGQAIFVVRFKEVLNDMEGPPEPPDPSTDPYPEHPHVEEADVTIETEVA